MLVPAALLLPPLLLAGACDSFDRPLKPFIDGEYERMRAVGEIVVLPGDAEVSPGRTRRFYAEVVVRADAPRDVAWGVARGDGSPADGSSIDPETGVLAAGAGDLGATLVVTATSVFDPGRRGSATVRVRDPYTVTFDAATPSVGSVSSLVDAGESVPYRAAHAPAPAGFAFAGWYEGQSGGSPVVFPYTPTRDITLFARWKYGVAVTGASGWEGAVAAVNAAAGSGSGCYRIDIASGIVTVPPSDSPGNPAINPGVNLTVAGSGTVALPAGPAGGSLLVVGDGTSLALDGPTLKGKDGNNAPLVKVESGGTFVLQGGTLTDNKILYALGGGVFVAGGGTFVMTGGSVTGNSSGGNGSGAGGVCVTGGTFTMTGGSIRDNRSENAGGGVAVLGSGAVFTMTGGSIRDNSTGAPIGGGVILGDGTLLALAAPAARSSVGNNTAYGGVVSNVYADDDATITVNGAVSGGW
jgi:uncharacterized repeat protein (TIGR02543 family)